MEAKPPFFASTLKYAKSVPHFEVDIYFLVKENWYGVPNSLLYDAELFEA